MYKGGMDNKGSRKVSGVGVGEQGRGEQEKKITLETFEKARCKPLLYRLSKLYSHTHSILDREGQDTSPRHHKLSNKRTNDRNGLLFFFLLESRSHRLTNEKVIAMFLVGCPTECDSTILLPKNITCLNHTTWGNQAGTNLDVAYLLARFHSARRCHTDDSGRKAIKCPLSCEPCGLYIQLCVTLILTTLQGWPESIIWLLALSLPVLAVKRDKGQNCSPLRSHGRSWVLWLTGTRRKLEFLRLIHSPSESYTAEKETTGKIHLKHSLQTVGGN